MKYKVPHRNAKKEHMHHVMYIRYNHLNYKVCGEWLELCVYTSGVYWKNHKCIWFCIKHKVRYYEFDALTRIFYVAFICKYKISHISSKYVVLFIKDFN